MRLLGSQMALFSYPSHDDVSTCQTQIQDCTVELYPLENRTNTTFWRWLTNMPITDFSPLDAVKTLTKRASQLGKPFKVTLKKPGIRSSLTGGRLLLIRSKITIECRLWFNLMTTMLIE